MVLNCRYKYETIANLALHWGMGSAKYDQSFEFYVLCVERKEAFKLFSIFLLLEVVDFYLVFALIFFLFKVCLMLNGFIFLCLWTKTIVFL